MKPDFFLANHRLFTREELAAALPGRATATLDAHLVRWQRQGRIVRVKQGLYLRQEPAGSGGPAPLPDFVALAARMAPDAAAAYHTALEAHGCAQSVFERLTFVTWTRTRAVEFLGRRLAPVRPRALLRAKGGGEAWIERLDRAGLEVRVTSLERTLADVLDRPSLAGGVEEVCVLCSLCPPSIRRRCWTTWRPSTTGRWRPGLAFSWRRGGRSWPCQSVCSIGFRTTRPGIRCIWIACAAAR